MDTPPSNLLRAPSGGEERVWFRRYNPLEADWPGHLMVMQYIADHFASTQDAVIVGHPMSYLFVDRGVLRRCHCENVSEPRALAS